MGAKGVGLGLVTRKGRWGSVGRNVGQSGGGKKGGVTIWDPNSPNSNPPRPQPCVFWPEPAFRFFEMAG